LPPAPTKATTPREGRPKACASELVELAPLPRPGRSVPPQARDSMQLCMRFKASRMLSCELA
jgi:hypothetical protein